MTCHPEVHDAAISQFNDYENEKRTEEYIVSLQDIASPDLTGVIVDACPDGLPREGSPTLLRRTRVTGVFNVVLYCAFRSAQSQLQQFTMNAVGAPSAVLPSHALDKSNSLFRERWTTQLVLFSGFAFPQPAVQITMPTQECIGLNDGQSLLPGSQPTGQHHQQDALARLAGRTYNLTIEHDELLP